MVMATSGETGTAMEMEMDTAMRIVMETATALETTLTMEASSDLYDTGYGTDWGFDDYPYNLLIP